MAGVTDIGLFLPIKHAVWFVYFVTVNTSRILSVVRTGMPFGELSPLMALHAHRVANVAR